MVSIVYPMEMIEKYGEQGEKNLPLCKLSNFIQSGRLRSRRSIKSGEKTDRSFSRSFTLVEWLVVQIVMCLRHDWKGQVQWEGESKSSQS